MLIFIELYYGFLKYYKEFKEWSDRNEIKYKFYIIVFLKGEVFESSKVYC